MHAIWDATEENLMQKDHVWTLSLSSLSLSAKWLKSFETSQKGIVNDETAPVWK